MAKDTVHASRQRPTMSRRRLVQSGGALAAGGLLVSTTTPGAIARQDKRTLYIKGSTRTYPGEDQAWQEVVTAFGEEFGVNVDTRFSGTWDGFIQQLQTIRLAQEPVDVITSGANTINSIQARSGVLMDLTEIIKPFRDRFEDYSMNALIIGDHAWGIPMGGVESSAVFYNVDMFKKLGIEPPKTYADTVAIAKTLAEQGEVMPWIHQGKATVMWPMWFFETYAQTTKNKSIETLDLFLKGERKFTSPEEIEAFAAIGRFAQDGVLARESLDTDGDGMRAAFAQQRAAMMYGGTWEIANLRAVVTDFEIGIFEFPLVTDDPNVISQHGGGTSPAIALPSFVSEGNLDLAAQFLEYTSRPAVANKLIAPAAPIGASVKGVESIDDPLAEPLRKTFFPNTIRFLDWIWPIEVNDAVVDGISGVVAGSTTPEDAAAGVQSAFETLVAEKDYQYNWWESWTEDDWKKVTPETIPNVVLG
ncbi:MAG: extracellular solute-binding protein [Thermomicrobiales bacterium]